jgi:UDP-N-acetylmuramoyl-tripeptide--D-alanyl-D-alanine ligase
MLHGPGDLLIIDDSYNAAPVSMQAALDLLDAASGRKIAVLGDMLELGSEEERAHREVGARAARSADWLVVCGPRSAWIAEEAEREGLEADRIRRTANPVEAVDAVRTILSGGEGGWSVLVKGSRGMKLEQVVSELRGTP